MKRIVKTVSGSLFWESGYPTGTYGGGSRVPSWFVDLRNQGKIKINCMTNATINLRSDGFIFHIQKTYDAYTEVFGSVNKCQAALEKMFKRENYSINDGSFWECFEYMPSPDCYDLNNLWRVAATAQRTGRFFYSAKRITAKNYILDDKEIAPWLYLEIFDQSTDEYEARYRERIARMAQEKINREDNAKKYSRTIEFEFETDERLKYSSYFEALSINENAGLREIKSAYWNLAKKYHPDLNPDNEVNVCKFQEIAHAYQELTKLF